MVTVPALPERGGDVLASRAAAAAGGGFNVMAAAARQGLRAAYAGAHGTGPFGTLARAALAEEGIEVIQPARAAPDTGFVLTMVETGGERTFLTSRGAEATLTAADLDRVRPAPRDAIYVSGYSLVHDSNRAALLGWLARLGDGQTDVLRSRPAGGVRPGRGAGRRARPGRLADLQRAGGRHPHRRRGPADGGSGAGCPAGPAAAGVLVRTGPGGCLIVRPGAGVVARARVSRCGVVDTNGAGDAHSGAFIAALAAGAGDTAAARSANAAAALSVTRRGPATAPTREELARFLATA